MRRWCELPQAWAGEAMQENIWARDSLAMILGGCAVLGSGATGGAAERFAWGLSGWVVFVMRE